MYTWHNLETDPPDATGVYLLAHRGFITAQNHFFAPDQEWFPGTKMGWQQDALRFRPTHWMYVPYPL